MCLLLVACLQFCFPSETFALTLVSWLALLVSHLCSLYQHLPQLTTVNIMPNLRVINTTLFDYYAISFSVRAASCNLQAAIARSESYCAIARTYVSVVVLCFCRLQSLRAV